MSTMTTLYIRDVSDDVAETLKARAAAAGTSLSAYVNLELTKIAARPTNAQLVERLRARDRSGGPTTEEIVAEVQAGRR
ncbi:antitoxin [Cellulomonas sp. HZM]|uniref:FitA-like ribbon-helix-helix domain-containing protein n=1 Tax=Cellulomonas sp. HZM TaxID=1454010 RepID=UPI001E42AC25|nr:antitoxin [Cellulomonas sp. HZM]